jgi:hypothetical protein
VLLVARVTNGCRPADNLCLLGPLICCTFAADSCLKDLICSGETAAGRSTVHGALQTRMCDVALMVCMLQVHTACWWFLTRPTPSLTADMLLAPSFTSDHCDEQTAAPQNCIVGQCKFKVLPAMPGNLHPTSIFIAHPNHLLITEGLPCQTNAILCGCKDHPVRTCFCRAQMH